MINLISDTITKPTPAMLAYMLAAPVGDDVFGEDPSVNALEQKMATMFGKETALFCPSGTMTNQIAMNVHTRPMDELICDHFSHVYQYEVSGYAFHSGLAVNPLVGKYGKITPQQIQMAVKPEADWLPNSRLVVLENSTNKGGGNYYTVDEILPIRQVCDENGLVLHLDGARIFNVLVETGETTQAMGAPFHSISVCLSKGLGAPVGSVLIGDRDFIQRARKVRKVFGGGMRQAGILAAAGIYALDHHIDDLKTDNNRAKILGEVLSNKTWVQNVLPVRTNIVIFQLRENLTAASFLEQLSQYHIKASPFGVDSVRFVLHRDISSSDFDQVISIIEKLEI